MSKRSVLAILVLGCLIGGAFTGLLFYHLGESGTPSVPGPNQPPRLAEATAAAPPTPDEATGIRIYEQLSPSVVNITTTEVSYDFFFEPYRESGTGSGSILDTDGHILTNHHVIEKADQILVSLTDKLKYPAEVVGFDEIDDLAVIRIKAPADQLKPLPMGTSADLKVGQHVFAIGNPFGLTRTMSHGIISSLGRSIKSRAGYIIDNVIQTDAAINPGNSGGPLIDAAGRLIGVNTSIFTTSGGSIGIGFAVPADTVRRVVADLIQYGKVRRPWVGVYGQDIDSQLAGFLKLPEENGVLVAYVEPGSSASQAGIQGGTQRVRLGFARLIIGGDFVVAVDDRAVTGQADFTSYLLNKNLGETVTVTLYRDGRKIRLPVKLIGKERGFQM